MFLSFFPFVPKEAPFNLIQRFEQKANKKQRSSTSQTLSVFHRARLVPKEAVYISQYVICSKLWGSGGVYGGGRRISGLREVPRYSA